MAALAEAPRATPASAPISGLGGLRLGDSAKPTPLPPSEAAPSSVEHRTPRAALSPVADPAAPLPARLDSLAASLDRVARDQHRRLSGILQPALEQATRLRRVFDIAGVSVDRYLARARRRGAEAGGVGGPFVAAPDLDGGRFELDLARAQSAVAMLDGLRRALPAMPVRAPLAGPLQPTSSFGYRTDPFLGRPALHSGLDLRDDYGAPVRAAAGGVVVAAGPRGGYGNLVEIDHGGGMSTRYGHLSAIDVAPGEPVKPGAFIGRVGSTGRSTGPHLHYEVRVDGEAVDPARFLEAASLLERTSK
jgi:murein DD-endopeptidase MepM/ murein hydrolase activator NlpD